MQVRTIVELVGGVLVVVVGFSFVQEREASARLAATLEAEKKTLADLQADRSKHEQADAQRDAATAEMIRSWQQTVAQLKTPQQQVAWSQSQLEQALKGITISLNPKTGEAVATIPQESVAELPKVIEQCRECQAKLTTAQADLASRLQQMALADQQIQALKTERDAAVTAAKGGTKWQRTVRTVKWLAIGVGVGYVVAKSH